MEHRRRQEGLRSDWQAVERGWFLGDKRFKEQLLAQMQAVRNGAANMRKAICLEFMHKRRIKM